MDIALLQKEICRIITGLGGRIRYTKELGLPARIYYSLTGKEPLINIEALFLGERFAVIIGHNRGRKNANMFNASGYRMIVCNSLADFKAQFDQLKHERLNA